MKNLGWSDFSPRFTFINNIELLYWEIWKTRPWRYLTHMSFSSEWHWIDKTIRKMRQQTEMQVYKSCIIIRPPAKSIKLTLFHTKSLRKETCNTTAIWNTDIYSIHPSSHFQPMYPCFEKSSLSKNPYPRAVNNTLHFPDVSQGSMKIL